MWISKRTIAMAGAAAIGAVSMTLVIGAFGALGKTHSNHGSHHAKRTGAPLIDESLAPSQPTDPTFHGVMRGSLPWVLKRGEVRLKRDGKFDLQVKGLVIPVAPFTGTPGPVTEISASLYCGADLNTAPAHTTQQVPISRKGDARIHDTHFVVPATCLAPVILVHPTLSTGEAMGAYIAVDGWRLSQAHS
jgi:hypothetical protein